jgi:hypothetical protein
MNSDDERKPCGTVVSLHIRTTENSSGESRFRHSLRHSPEIRKLADLAALLGLCRPLESSGAKGFYYSSSMARWKLVEWWGAPFFGSTKHSCGVATGFIITF